MELEYGRDQGLEFRVCGSGFRVQGLGFRVCLAQLSHWGVLLEGFLGFVGSGSRV